MHTRRPARDTAEHLAAPDVDPRPRHDVASHPGATLFDELAGLIDRAGRLDPRDHPAGTGLRARAHEVTSRLASSGLLPSHLVVGRDDPPVVVVRTLARVAREDRRR